MQERIPCPVICLYHIIINTYTHITYIYTSYIYIILCTYI
jgi:hypothetical protein